MALNQLNRSSGPVSFGYAELENNNAAQASILTDFASQTTPGIDKSGLTLKTELKSSSPMDPNKPPVAASPTKRKIFVFNIFSKNLVNCFEFSLFLANIGGWIKSPNQEVIDLELEEAVTSEDISQDQSFGPESPSTPQAPSKSQTKTYA